LANLVNLDRVSKAYPAGRLLDAVSLARAYDRHQGLGGPALRTLLLLDLLDVWEIGQELQQPWFNGSDFYEWADPLAADAVVRTQAALHEK
jgi:hypothetical protein